MATDYINAAAQKALDQEYAGTEQALEARLAAMPDPSLAASIAAVNRSLPRGSVTAGPLQIFEEGGHYGNAAQQQEAYFEAVGRYVDSVSVDSADIARANAGRTQQYAADLANQRALNELDRQNGLAIAKFMAIGPLGGAVGVAAAASPWVAGALSVYNGYEGGQSIKDGHPIWGAIQIGAGLIGAVGAAPGMANDVASMFDRLSAPMFGSPAAQAGKLDVGAFVSNNEAVDAVAARRTYLSQKFGRTGDLNLDINIRGNQDVAFNYFRLQGISEADANAYMMGIDFSQPVEIQTLNSSKSLWQYQAPGAPQGDWYSFTPDATPSELGISPYGVNRADQAIQPKILNMYETSQPVSVLRSTSAAVEDKWSVPGQSYPAIGGARQIYSPQKQAFYPWMH
jgi:hypothetical protein